VFFSNVAFDGIVTVVGPNEPVEFARVVIDDAGVLPSAKVIDSFGSKLVPFTVKDPPGTEHPELAVSTGAGPLYWPNAAVDHPKLSPKPTTAETIAILRLMARALWFVRHRPRLWSQRWVLTWANVTFSSELVKRHFGLAALRGHVSWART